MCEVLEAGDGVRGRGVLKVGEVGSSGGDGQYLNVGFLAGCDIGRGVTDQQDIGRTDWCSPRLRGARYGGTDKLGTVVMVFAVAAAVELDVGVESEDGELDLGDGPDVAGDDALRDAIHAGYGCECGGCSGQGVPALA